MCIISSNNWVPPQKKHFMLEQQLIKYKSNGPVHLCIYCTACWGNSRRTHSTNTATAVKLHKVPSTHMLFSFLCQMCLPKHSKLGCVLAFTAERCGVDSYGCIFMSRAIGKWRGEATCQSSSELADSSLRGLTPPALDSQINMSLLGLLLHHGTAHFYITRPTLSAWQREVCFKSREGICRNVHIYKEGRKGRRKKGRNYTAVHMQKNVDALCVTNIYTVCGYKQQALLGSTSWCVTIISFVQYVCCSLFL